MRSQTDQRYRMFLFVYPYKQKISLDMAFHASYIIACQHMWSISCLDGTCIP